MLVAYTTFCSEGAKKTPVENHFTHLFDFTVLIKLFYD
jgi:hypothetical protein